MLNGFFLSSTSHTLVLNRRYQAGWNTKQSQMKIIFPFYTVLQVFTVFRMGLFGAAHIWEGLFKVCHTYLILMKIGTVIPYLKNIWKIHKSRDKPLEFCWHKHFFSENQQFLVYQEIYRSFKIFLNIQRLF